MRALGQTVAISDRHQSDTGHRPGEAKPRLVFFQRKYDKAVPPFLLEHGKEHVKGLREFFDVTVVNWDCDYRQICDAHRPDLAVFEVGTNLAESKRLNIDHVKNDGSVIKIAFQNSDAWCETRSGIISEMEHWGIECSFSIAITAAEHTQPIADRLFVWPNFIDPEIFSDYGEKKVVEMLLTGARAAQYPWRTQVFQLSQKHFRTINLEHPGYFGKPMNGNAAIHGEPYARAINSAVFSPTCGTVAKEVVRKHFEIPACRTCLITERSPGLTLAGYVDMVNCVFADAGNILDKVNYLLENPERLRAITDAGYSLVHSRHTYRQRDQILQWYALQSRRRPGDVIVQPNPFEPPRIAAATERSGQIYLRSGGEHLALIAEGDALYAQGDYSLAEGKYAECLAYMRMLPEARLKVVRCRLSRGQSDGALALMTDLVGYTLAGYRAHDPDPVEWAYYIIALLCSGKYRQASARACQFRSLRHVELDRIRKVLAFLNQDIRMPDVEGEAPGRTSIHRMPDRNIDDWLADLIGMLEASGQSSLALQVGTLCSTSRNEIVPPSKRSSSRTPGPHSFVVGLASRMRLALYLAVFRDPVEYFYHRRRVASLKRRLAPMRGLATWLRKAREWRLQ